MLFRNLLEGPQLCVDFRPSWVIAKREGRLRMAVRDQLELLGLEESLRIAEAAGTTPIERRKLCRRVELAHELLSTLPGPEDLSYLHSGLCQTHLPRSRPERNRDVWVRQSGRFPGLFSSVTWVGHRRAGDPG